MPDGEIVDTLGTASIVRSGSDATILALALMVPRALEAAERLKAEHGIDCEVIDVRSLVPLDTQTILGSVAKTHRLFTVEENPRLCGWGAEIVSIVADEAFYDLDGPPVRITTPHLPLPAADIAGGRRAAQPSTASSIEYRNPWKRDSKPLPGSAAFWDFLTSSPQAPRAASAEPMDLPHDTVRRRPGSAHRASSAIAGPG